MTETAARYFDIDGFLAWSEGREGAFELHDGQPVALSPEQIRHTGVKTETAVALREAIRRANVSSRAVADGVTLRIRHDRAFVPDVVVVCPAPPPDAVVIDDALIVVEVLSPSTVATDHGLKFEGYFSLPGLAHYLILDADRQVCIHHARGRGDVIETRIVRDGALRLDPPGIDVSVADFFAADR